MTFYKTKQVELILGDCIEEMKNINDQTIDVIFADPPYFLSSNGITCQNGQMVSVNKGDWDRQVSLVEKHTFNLSWIKECYRLLKKDGTIWVSGTYHNIYSIGMALEETGFEIINNITWQKTNPPPNLSCRYFVHSTETILWAKKKGSKHYFNYELMKSLNGGKQHKDVWISPIISKKEKSYGKHPTQKPQWLIEKILQASSKEGDVVLDPFNGSGTTGVAAVSLNRAYVGIETDEEYLSLTLRRLNVIERKVRTLFDLEEKNDKTTE